MKQETITAKEYRKLKGKKSNKYHNEKVIYAGEKFDSKKECERWKELLIAQAMGCIKDLRRQVKFELLPKQPGQRAINYIADFVYEETFMDTPGKNHRGGELYKTIKVVEDCKGYRTAIYRQKKKWMRAKYGIDILES